MKLDFDDVLDIGKFLFLLLLLIFCILNIVAVPIWLASSMTYLTCFIASLKFWGIMASIFVILLICWGIVYLMGEI